MARYGKSFLYSLILQARRRSHAPVIATFVCSNNRLVSHGVLPIDLLQKPRKPTKQRRSPENLQKHMVKPKKSKKSKVLSGKPSKTHEKTKKTKKTNPGGTYKPQDWFSGTLGLYD